VVALFRWLLAVQVLLMAVSFPYLEAILPLVLVGELSSTQVLLVTETLVQLPFPPVEALLLLLEPAALFQSPLENLLDITVARFVFKLDWLLEPLLAVSAFKLEMGISVTVATSLSPLETPLTPSPRAETSPYRPVLVDLEAK
jgi:hypothetical protein